MANEGGRMLKLKQWLSVGQSRPISLTEFKEFWQACTAEERAAFCEQAGIE